MRRVALSVILCLASAACGVADATQPAVTVTSTTTMATTTTPSPSSTTSAAPTTTAVEVLDVASLPEGSSLVLGAREAVEVFAGPDGSELI
ncbi:MAG TPA: hypothetical protein VHM29_00520, partial [Acidimicrobiia bacterium]|nr:hypothetical protein [Acidimicrobiia bacterium]